MSPRKPETFIIVQMWKGNSSSETGAASLTAATKIIKEAKDRGYENWRLTFKSEKNVPVPHSAMLD